MNQKMIRSSMVAIGYNAKTEAVSMAFVDRYATVLMSHYK
jgi:hypothetical protein